MRSIVKGLTCAAAMCVLTGTLQAASGVLIVSKTASSAAAQQVFAVGTVADQGYSGVPVRQTLTIAGREMTTEITEVSRQTFPDSVFAVPEGFQKQSPGAGRGRR